MSDRLSLRRDINRILPRGAGWFTSVLAFAVLLTACGGGGGGDLPPLTPAASLRGSVTFTPQVPLAAPPGDAFDGPPPANVRYGARIVDPGDDIGGAPLPKPSTMQQSGEYEFAELNPDPLAYFNLRFTVPDDLEGGDSTRTPVGFNIPISLAPGFSSLLSCVIDRPADTVLQMNYVYRGPNGSRETRLRLDFATDLLYFDLDGDGAYDDSVAVDTNHDAIPDGHAPLMETFDPKDLFRCYGPVTAVGSRTIAVGGETFEVWGSTNITNAVTDTALSLSECSIGAGANVLAVPYGSGNVGITIKLLPDPGEPGGRFPVRREGIIETIDQAALFVGGIWFHDYPNADITNQLGGPVQPEELEVGQYVTVIGVREGNTVWAELITLRQVSPPPGYVEREGPIEALEPEDAPTSMTVDGIVFQLTPTTLIKDIDGQALDTGYLVQGSPVWVFGRQAGESIIADIIELRYSVLPPGESHFEFVVLVKDEETLQVIESAIAGLDPSVSVAALLVATYPPSWNDPPCVQHVFSELSWSEYIIMYLPGYQGAYPRVIGDECLVLIVVEDVYPDTVDWIEYFFPWGIADAPIEYDFVSLQAPYGAGPEWAEAMRVADFVNDLLESNPGIAEGVVDFYISPDITFSDP